MSDERLSIDSSSSSKLGYGDDTKIFRLPWEISQRSARKLLGKDSSE